LKKSADRKSPKQAIISGNAMALKALNFLARRESTDDLCFPGRLVGNKGNMGDEEVSVGTQYQQELKLELRNFMLEYI
jgi:hypothetical protein